MLVRTMKGKLIDITSLLSENENTVAVTGSGLRMNARGDILGPGGKVIKKKEDLEKEYAVKIENSVKNSKNVPLSSTELNRYTAEQKEIKRAEMNREMQKIAERNNQIRRVVNTGDFINPDDPNFDEKLKKQILSIKEEDISQPPPNVHHNAPEGDESATTRKTKKKSPPPDEIMDE